MKRLMTAAPRARADLETGRTLVLIQFSSSLDGSAFSGLQLLDGFRSAGWQTHALLAHLASDLPRNLLRGLLGTPSSQPLSCTLHAHAQLLRLAPRLLSARTDRSRWRAHLTAIGWEDALATEPARPSPHPRPLN